MLVSLKAGGTGLNLTAAAHVVHFDRWWNPAVENQATDRAFRIGQTRNVLVHSGSTMYTVAVTVEGVTKPHWSAICRDCSGAIDSLVELLQGRLSKAVMTRLCQERTGLFPSPKDILFRCSCPDWASMCKHVAAVLYGIGARLDHQPELLFTLRKVDQQDLIAKAGSDLSKKPKRFTSAKALASEDLSAMFGIEIAPATPPARAAGGTVAAKRPAATRSNALSGPTKMSTPAAPKAAAACSAS